MWCGYINYCPHAAFAGTDETIFPGIHGKLEQCVTGGGEGGHKAGVECL